MATEIKENYLKAIYFLDQKDKDISLSALANNMQVSKTYREQYGQETGG